ncbi:MAG TPA: histidine kinase, partial [Rhodobiaceae bacterium]|nr:histidine kinase [Rhodobiaceae bacterium]
DAALKSGKSLTISVADELVDSHLFVRGARDELRQVFQNLVENAMRYGTPETDIVIKVNVGRLTAGQSRENLLRVQIINEGDTIAPEHLARLTERFYRIDKGRSRQFGGTGLGLAIVKHIVNRHRGRLRISSEQGETKVSVTLPRFFDS